MKLCYTHNDAVLFICASRQNCGKNVLLKVIFNIKMEVKK